MMYYIAFVCGSEHPAKSAWHIVCWGQTHIKTKCMYLKPDSSEVSGNGVQPLQHGRHWQRDQVAERQGRQLAGCWGSYGIKLVQPPVQEPQQQLLSGGGGETWSQVRQLGTSCFTELQEPVRRLQQSSRIYSHGICRYTDCSVSHLLMPLVAISAAAHNGRMRSVCWHNSTVGLQVGDASAAT